jgi:hypothetical protein
MMKGQGFYCQPSKPDRDYLTFKGNYPMLQVTEIHSDTKKDVELHPAHKHLLLLSLALEVLAPHSQRATNTI